MAIEEEAGGGSVVDTVHRGIQGVTFVGTGLLFTLGMWGNGFFSTIFVAFFTALIATLIVSAAMNFVRNIIGF